MSLEHTGGLTGEALIRYIEKLRGNQNDNRSTSERRMATVDSQMLQNRAERNGRRNAQGILSGACSSGYDKGALSGRGSGASSAYILMRNSAATQSMTSREQALLDRDAKTYLLMQLREGDKDCGKVPLYLPTNHTVASSFYSAIGTYLDQGMDYTSAWLAAKENNPQCYSVYLRSENVGAPMGPLIKPRRR